MRMVVKREVRREWEQQLTYLPYSASIPSSLSSIFMSHYHVSLPYSLASDAPSSPNPLPIVVCWCVNIFSLLWAVLGGVTEAKMRMESTRRPKERRETGVETRIVETTSGYNEES